MKAFFHADARTWHSPAVSLLLLIVLLPFLAAPSAQAKTYFVAPTGNDANPGTQTRPFKTLSAACRKTPQGKNTIRLAAGTFTEIQPSMLPPGVSLVGAGEAKTILHWTITQDMELNPTIIVPEKFMIQVYDSTDASLSNFTMEGKIGQERAHAGIIAHRVRNLQIHHIWAKSFNFTAIYLSQSEGSSIHHCRLDDNGHPNKATCSGGISLGPGRDVAIHDCTIREHRGAYGIKSCYLKWTEPNARPWEPGNRMPLTRVKIYNNDVKVRQQGGWGNGQPNMALEFWNCRVSECEIYNNRFNECISLTGSSSAPKTIRVHHNRFVLERGYSYALEADTHNLEIDHNYFANGCYPIACFGDRRDGLYIHHNVFDDIENIQLMVFSGGVKDFRFVNNTIYLKNTFPILVMSGNSENIQITHNLFYREGSPSDSELVVMKPNKESLVTTITPGTLNISDNAFYNWKPSGAGAVIGDPKLAESGSREDFSYFKLRADSPLIKARIGATAQ